MLNLTRLHLGIAHESQFQGLGIQARAGSSSRTRFAETVSTGTLLWNRNPRAALSEFETTYSDDEICAHPVDRAGCDRGLCMERGGCSRKRGRAGRILSKP